ncbi:hypothetical protein DM860_016832 [Cuscuta australis]|uniref:Uncharacterized protein n=1 Tax=Cuscuta australis TaxID=267555 RepID=A0A328CWG1_9ASTE|nr:hypothetical protein DM860_016832 [Cuscuta australis]
MLGLKIAARGCSSKKCSICFLAWVSRNNTQFELNRRLFSARSSLFSRIFGSVGTLKFNICSASTLFGAALCCLQLVCSSFLCSIKLHMDSRDKNFDTVQLFFT